MIAWKKLLAICAFVIAAPAFAQTEVKDPPALWQHRVTGVGFPAQTGEFQRRRIAEFNATGSDAGAGYDLVRDGRRLATMTIYVYPDIGLGCEGTYRDAQRAITNNNKDATLRFESKAPSPTGSTPDSAWFARYGLMLPFENETPQKMSSDLYVQCVEGGKWFVKYRATYPATLNLDREIQEFLRSFRWPAPFNG